MIELIPLLTLTLICSWYEESIPHIHLLFCRCGSKHPETLCYGSKAPHNLSAITIAWIYR